VLLAVQSRSSVSSQLETSSGHPDVLQFGKNQYEATPTKIEIAPSMSRTRVIRRDEGQSMAKEDAALDREDCSHHFQEGRFAIPPIVSKIDAAKGPPKTALLTNRTRQLPKHTEDTEDQHTDDKVIAPCQMAILKGSSSLTVSRRRSDLPYGLAIEDSAHELTIPRCTTGRSQIQSRQQPSTCQIARVQRY
jgi:hypothetical protein